MSSSQFLDRVETGFRPVSDKCNRIEISILFIFSILTLQIYPNKVKKTVEQRFSWSKFSVGKGKEADGKELRDQLR